MFFNLKESQEHNLNLIVVIGFLQLDLPEGLINLGNTCYMNATVQCLKTVPELKNALLSYEKCKLFVGYFNVTTHLMIGSRHMEYLLS